MEGDSRPLELWRVISSSSGLWWPNGSQTASGASFELFWALVAK